jgi:hypothetical protein
MAKLLFRPVGILSGILAGVLGRRAFAGAWARIDERGPPKPEERRSGLGKLAGALALEGAVFAVSRGLIDHASRQWFKKVTGMWPGDGRTEDQVRADAAAESAKS